MKKKMFSLMMTLLLAFIGVAKADVVTIGEGTGTTYYFPIDNYFNYSCTEQIYLASEVGTAGTINAISFYYNYGTSYTCNNVTMYMKNVSRSEFTSTTDCEPLALSDIVWSGAIAPTAAGWYTFTLDTPFRYDGTSNLLVAFFDGISGYPGTAYNWRQTTSPGSANMALRYYSDGTCPDPYNLSSYTGGKVRYTYRSNVQIDITPGAGVEDQLHVRFMAGEEEIIDELNLGVRPVGAWMEPFQFTMYSNGPNYTVTVLDFTPSDGMFSVEGEELPFQVSPGQDIGLTMACNGTQAGVIERQFVAITEGNRAAHIWPVTVELYSPECPDVVEVAYDLGTITPGFSYVGVPADITPTTLHDDYTLPFPEIPEGVDGVYKLTFEQDQMLNAYVSQGENGKVALYTEDFYGEGGPMATNYYTGPGLGGGASFEAMIGDENSTTVSSYFPFHVFFRYSIGENLFLASELAEAGVTTAPMTSLSWYVSSTTCTQEQNGISIWMANVSETEIPTMSHITSNMTLVYTGDNLPAPEVGWNEFVFNEGRFAWDGVSNILIVCQRNNGQYQGRVNWQTHNPGFYAMGYNYTDGTAYDMMNGSYSLSRSNTNRANIIFKGGNRNRDVILTEDFENGIGDWTMSNCHNSTGVSSGYSSYAHSGSNLFRFYWTTNPPQYLISPMLTGTENGVDVSFFYTGFSTLYTETFHVGYSTTTNAIDAFTFGPEVSCTADGEWSEYTNSFPAGTKYVAVKHTANNQFYLFLDDFTFTAAAGGGEQPSGEIAYGPVIENLPVAPGTYYLVASSTDPDFEVTINAETIPCPQVDGFAFGPTPADDEDGIEPASVTLRWNIPDYATGWRLIFGTTYYPEPGHPQTIMYPEDGSFSRELANSFTVHNLWNNTNYFWHVEFNNDGCPEGVSSPIWGFTTYLNIPNNLRVEDETIFEGEDAVLIWDAVVDRTYRMYNVYQDGQLIGHTTINDISNSTYTVSGLTYNMEGYTFQVSAVYDEGESALSDPVVVKVSGYSNATGINGHVWEQDGTTGIAGATVTVTGIDEFNDPHVYTFTTNAQGYYNGQVYAGTYTNAVASMEGYQDVTTVHELPFVVGYNTQVDNVDFLMDENFDPVCTVIAEYYPDSLDSESPYVKVYWGCGLPGEEIIEPFETGDFSLFDWQLDPAYPWTITTYNPYEGQYCMKSGGAGVPNVVSNMTVTVNIPYEGIMSFFGKISSESNYDFGHFYIDNVEMGSWSGAGNWAERTYQITEGTHTFQWRYTKDGSVNSNDDCFYVDYITFYKRPAPPIPGMTYDFENSSMQGWTTIDADGDGWNWMLGSEVMGTGYGHNGSADLVLSQSYSNNFGVLYPDNYLVSPQVELGGLLRFYACAQDADYAAEHFGVAVSTTNNNNPSAFTMVQEWTMSAKSVGGIPAKVSTMDSYAKGKGHSRGGNSRAQGNWYEYTVDLSAYSGMGYVAIRHFNCSDMFYLNVDDITIGEPGKGFASNDRSLHHYNVYRTNCYNDGPYTAENTVFLATVWVPDTVYIDVEWADLPAGVYKWGVGTVYQGNRGELVESPISWTEPMGLDGKSAVEANRDEFTYGFEGDLEGWTVLTVNSGQGEWLHSSNNPGGYDYTNLAHGGTGFAMCYSFIDYVGAFTTDSYLISPQKYAIENGSTLTFYADNANDSYPESFSVCIATAANPTAGDFTTLWGGNAKSNTGQKSTVRHDEDRYQNWRSHSVDLSAYAGQNVWIAFHDQNYDMYEIWIDDVTITAGSGGGGGGGGGLNELAEPRESETIWSNCLDKDMNLSGENNQVTVNVLLNSADSPEGVTVTFTNYNEVEQDMYPVAPVVLDETGFYAFESFRKGEYNVKVEFDGYATIEDSVSIWNPTDLRYVMTEIIYGVSDLYVSSTGWAMWGAEGTPVNPNPDPNGNGSTFIVDFETGMPDGWTTIDADGDGYNWVLGSAAGGIYLIPGASLAGSGHNASGDLICSGSYENNYYQALHPDNFLVSPQVTLAAGSIFSFWACGQDASYAAEHFGVAVSDNGTSNWTMVQEWTMTAKGSGNGVMSYGRDGNNRVQGNWYQYNVDLSAYAGQKYIAIRHFNCTDQFILDVDDIELTAGAKSGDDRHLEYFKVMCTSIDGEPIYNADVPANQPFCQLNTDGLVEGNHYIAKVAAMYSTGMSDWSECEWQYIPCDNYTGTVSGVEVNGTTISWEYPGNGPTPPDEGSTFNENFDSGIPAGWTAIDADGDGFNWVSSMTPGLYHNSGVDLTGTGHNGSAAYVISGSWANGTGQVLYPDNYFVSPQVTLVNGSHFSFWACAQDANYPADHFGVAISDNGTSDWTMVNEWTMTAKGGGGVMSAGRNGQTRVQGNWYHYDVDLSAFAGQKYIAVRHFNCSDQFILNVDDFELTVGAKGNRNPWELMMTFNAAESGQYGVAYDGTNFYTSNWGYSGASNNFYKYDLNGNMIEGFNISGCGTLRGITYDGQYFYGVANSAMVYCVDLAAHSLVSTFSSSYGAMRGITYDPQRDGFWVIGNWSGNLTLIDRMGVVQQEGPAPESVSDLAYYKDENDVEHIFCFKNSTNDVVDYNITTNTLGGSVFNFTNTPGFASGAASGGCTVGSFNGKIAFIGDLQQDPNLIGIYELRDDNGVVPPIPSVDILGAMIFADGEWEAFVPYPTAEYTYEGDAEQVCVRMVYNGTNTLPEGNIYYSMSCEECVGDVPGACAPGAPIHAELMDNGDDVKIWWGDAPAEPVNEWLYYDDGTYAMSVGVQAGATIYWASMFPANVLAPYAGTNLTKVALYEGEYNTSAITVTIYLGGTTAPGTAYSTMTYTPAGNEDFNEVTLDTPVAIDGTQNLWIVFSEYGTYVANACVDTGDANNRWISTNGTTWQDVADAGVPGYGWMIRGFVTNQAKGIMNTPIEVAPQGEGTMAELGHTEAVSYPAPMAFLNRANRAIQSYNVYRSTSATGDYELIGTVAEDNSGYYEYIDSPATAGTYYYQVRADYGDCESEPAQAYDNPSVNYVSATTDGLNELDGKVSLYPNPTSGNVTIEAEGMTHITVVSVLGQMVYDTELSADSYTLNMAQFNAGMYMVRVYTESGMTVKRVTVMQ